MKKRNLSELRKLEFKAVDKKCLKTLKGGDGPMLTRYWTSPECPDIELDDC